MAKARRKSPRTSKRTKTNAADERAGAVIESLTSDVDVKEKILEEMTLAGYGRKDFSPLILLFYERLVNINNHGLPDCKPCHVLAATFIQSLIMIHFLLLRWESFCFFTGNQRGRQDKTRKTSTDSSSCIFARLALIWSTVCSLTSLLFTWSSTSSSHSCWL